MLSPIMKFILLSLAISTLAAPTHTLGRRQPESLIPSAAPGLSGNVKVMEATVPSASAAAMQGGAAGGSPAEGGGGSNGLGDLANLIGQGVQAITKIIGSVTEATSGGGGESKGAPAPAPAAGGGDLGDIANLIGQGAQGLNSLISAAGSAGDGLGDIASLISNAAGGLGGLGNFLGGLGGLVRRDTSLELQRATEKPRSS
jgi:hypothetical protein